MLGKHVGNPHQEKYFAYSTQALGLRQPPLWLAYWKKDRHSSLSSIIPPLVHIYTYYWIKTKKNVEIDIAESKWRNLEPKFKILCIYRKIICSFIIVFFLFFTFDFAWRDQIKFLIFIFYFKQRGIYIPYI